MSKHSRPRHNSPLYRRRFYYQMERAVKLNFRTAVGDVYLNYLQLTLHSESAGAMTQLTH